MNKNQLDLVDQLYDVAGILSKLAAEAESCGPATTANGCLAADIRAASLSCRSFARDFMRNVRASEEEVKP